MLREAFNAPSPATPTSQSFGVLILEIAADLEPLADILNRHHITKSQWLQLRGTPVFVAALKEQVKAFQGLHNIGARVKMKAQLLTERLLDHMYDIATQPAYPPSSRVAAFGQIKALTGLEKPEDAQPFRRFALTINLASGRRLTETAVTLNAIAERDAADADPHSLIEEAPSDPTLELDDTDAIEAFEEEDFTPLGDEIDEPRERFEARTTPATAPPSVGDRSWSGFATKPGPPLNHPGPPPAPNLSRHSGVEQEISSASGRSRSGAETASIPKPTKASALQVINRLRGV